MHVLPADKIVGEARDSPTSKKTVEGSLQKPLDYKRQGAEDFLDFFWFVVDRRAEVGLGALHSSACRHYPPTKGKTSLHWANVEHTTLRSGAEWYLTERPTSVLTLVCLVNKRRCSRVHAISLHTYSFPSSLLDIKSVFFFCSSKAEGCA